MKQNLAQKPEAKSQEPKPSARNPKPVVRNPKTKTQNPKSVLLRFPVRSCLPEADAVLREQGIPEGRADRRIVEALAEALDLFAGLAEPVGREFGPRLLVYGSVSTASHVVLSRRRALPGDYRARDSGNQRYANCESEDLNLAVQAEDGTYR